MNNKEFNKYVKAFRATMPVFNNGRYVKVLSEYSKAGKTIIDRASRCEGHDLRQVYDKWSDAKQTAYNEVFDMYLNSPHATAFGICSKNSFGFSVSWVSDYGIHFITKNYEYIVLTNEKH